jgi:hypothetical protein
VYGTVASAFSPILYSVVITLIRPQNYDWADFKKKKLAFDSETPSITAPSINVEEQRASDVELKRWGRTAAIWALATFLGHWVLWPLPMYASKYVFGERVSSPAALPRT